jgi:SAM-dependent methyltransferase
MSDSAPASGFDPRVIGAAYDGVAAEYAAKFAGDLEGLPLDREFLDSIRRRAPGPGPVLDIGCGPAQAGSYLAARGARVIGIDLAPGMLAAASSRQASLRQAGLLGLAAADMRALPVAGGSCAAAVSMYALHHLPRSELPAVLREFRRILAAAGILLLATHEGTGEFATANPRIMGTLYTGDELRQALMRESFRVDPIRQRDPLPHEMQSGRIYVMAAASPHG